MRHYCTYFDQNYLTRGLTLYRSLKRHDSDFRLWVLCLDGESRRILELLALPEVATVSLEELEAADPDLASVKPTRSRVEYFFTITPSWIRYLLPRVDRGDWLTYLDADLFFYSSPHPIFDELGAASVGIIAHRFPERLRELERHGVYNVGFLAFRNDVDAAACLAHWREQCLEWCYDRVEDGRFGDQKYLDSWPERFPGVHVIEHPGAGLAPWNFMSYRTDPRSEPPTVNGEPLIFYHFHALKILNRWVLDPGLEPFGTMPAALRRFLYGGYLRELKRAARAARTTAPDTPLGASIRSGPEGRSLLLRTLLSGRAMVSLT